jgi:putative intracellular protease/amidase
MKKLKKPLIIIFSGLIVLGAALYFSFPQVFAYKTKSYQGGSDFHWQQPKTDSTKKTIFILADNAGTEIFDLMAPFYLFNATEKSNVYIVAEKKAPVLLFNTLFILPHFSFSEIDSLNISADVIVVPNLTIRLKVPPKASTVNWLKKQYTGSNIMLSICDGSATVAATGIYDGKPLTTHATDYNTLKERFPKPVWVKDVSVTEQENLYSTAGVSNAVEGSLAVIEKIFGKETMGQVMDNVGYPYSEIKMKHESVAITKGSAMKLISKLLFKPNLKIGVFLEDGINEFQLAGILDTYERTFPFSINSFSINNKRVTSKYGLTIYPTGDIVRNQVNELHVLQPELLSLTDNRLVRKAEIVKYNPLEGVYPIDDCLRRIRSLYGSKFEGFVRLMLDYKQQ